MTTPSMWRIVNKRKPSDPELQILVDGSRYRYAGLRPISIGGRIQAFLDDFTGVSDHQKMQRLGLIKHEVVEPLPSDGFDEWFDRVWIEPILRTLHKKLW